MDQVIGIGSIGAHAGASITLYQPKIPPIQLNFKQINEVLNRYDIEKDAKTGVKAWGIPGVNFFYESIFYDDKIEPYSRLSKSTFLNLKKTIIDDVRFGGSPMRFSLLTKPSTEHKKLSVEFIYQESGFTVKNVETEEGLAYKIVFTPGSYIDPGTRKAPSKLARDEYIAFPPLNTSIVLSEAYLAQYGFGNNLQQIKSEIRDDFSCEFTITTKSVNVNRASILRAEDITTRFNNSLKKISSGTDYFLSNPEKNRKLNDPALDDHTKTIYILTKELGDTLQVLYAAIHTQSIANPLNSVLFTVDETVLARSRLSGLSVAMQERDDITDELVCNYYLPISTPADLLRQQKLIKRTEALLINNSLIKRISRVITNGFKFNDTTYQLKPGVAVLFEGLITIIKTQLNNIISSPHEGTLDEYETLLAQHTVIDIFKEHGKNNIIPNRVTDRVFHTIYRDRGLDFISKWCDDQRHEHPGERKRFINLLLELSDGTPQIEYSSPAPSSAKRRRFNTPTEGGGDVEDKTLTEEFLDVVMKFTDEETAEDFLLTIYNQLNYIGRTPLNPKIVQQLFQHVLELINLSFKDFSTAYAYLNETIGNEIRAEKERKLALNFKMPSMYADDHPLKTMKRKLVSATAGSNTRRKLPTKK